jgi:hypothetical protein
MRLLVSERPQRRHFGIARKTRILSLHKLDQIHGFSECETSILLVSNMRALESVRGDEFCNYHTPGLLHFEFERRYPA